MRVNDNLLIVLIILITIVGYLGAFKTKETQSFRSNMLGSIVKSDSRYDFWVLKIIGSLMFFLGVFILIVRLLKILF